MARFCCHLCSRPPPRCRRAPWSCLAAGASTTACSEHSQSGSELISNSCVLVFGDTYCWMFAFNKRSQIHCLVIPGPAIIEVNLSINPENAQHLVDLICIDSCIAAQLIVDTDFKRYLYTFKLLCTHPSSLGHIAVSKTPLLFPHYYLKVVKK